MVWSHHENERHSDGVVVRMDWEKIIYFGRRNTMIVCSDVFDNLIHLQLFKSCE